MNKIKILIVEDQRATANKIKKDLIKMNYEVTSIVTFGEKVIKAIKNNEPDLALMDIILQGKTDGIDAAKQIKACYDIPIVYLTAFPGEFERAKPTEPFGYLLKPFDIKVLDTTIRAALYKHSTERVLKQYKYELEKLAEDKTLRLLESASNFNTAKLIGKHVNEHILKLHKVVEQSPAIVLITDTDGKIEYVNPAFIRITGYTSEEVIGKDPKILNSGKQLPEIYKEMWDAIKSGHEWHGEFCNRRKNGEYYWESVLISSIKNRDGIIINFVKTAEDITKRKFAEVELLKSHERLLHSEKLSAVGKLSASIAHEFNNPLAGIRNVLDIIAERYDNNDIDEYEKNLINLSLKECDRIAGLIHNLQDFNRPSSDIEAMVNIHDIINEVLMLYERKLKQKSILLKKYYTCDIPKIKVVPDQIKQVILNLIQNAEESIAENNGTITIKTECDDLNVLIHIEDTGDGISKQNMSTIFQPFFTTKPAVTGTGLGLSVCYGIIKKHKGDIKVESKPGKGTTFTVVIPVSS